MLTAIKVSDVRNFFAEILSMFVADGDAHWSVYLLSFNDFPQSLHNIEKSIVLSMPCSASHWFSVSRQDLECCKWSIIPNNWSEDDRNDRGFPGFMSLH